MKYILSILVVVCMVSCQTKYEMIDSGLAKGQFDGNMYEYFKSNSYNWDSLRIMIERADLVDLFEGKREGYEQITFWGPTNISIRRWMLEPAKPGDPAKPKRLADMKPAECEKFVMAHVVKGKMMLDEIPRGDVTLAGDTGGIVITGGNSANQIWAYTEQLPYQEIIGVGAVVIRLRSLRTSMEIEIASSNIEPTTGVVHSLHPNYTLGEL